LGDNAHTVPPTKLLGGRVPPVSALVLSPQLLNLIIFLLFLNLFTGLKLMREFSTKLCLSHIILKLSTLVILHIFILFLVLNAVVLHARLLCFLVTLNRLSNNYRLKITNRSFHHTAPALWNSLPPDLRHFSSHSTSS
jgi:hypothetical protein